MSDSLKEGHKLNLSLIILANFAFCYLILEGKAILSGEINAIISEWTNALPAGAGLLLAGILNAQFDSQTKARLVFWRWNYPLPGSEAFTRYAKEDPRIDLAMLKRTQGPLPKSLKDQNALWYRLYKSVEEELAVRQAHSEYLFTRDYACIAVLMVLSLGPIVFFQIPSTKITIIYNLLLLGQYLLARRAARNHGIRLVTTVLALKSAGR